MIAASIDIRPFVCPMTWVKTKLALEAIQPGEELEILLGEGEPARNVPRSALLEGHAVAAMEPRDGAGWRLVLVKGSDAAIAPDVTSAFEP